MAAALVLAAEAVTALKANDANGSDGGVAVIGCTSLVMGGGAYKLIQLLICCRHYNLYLY